MNEISSSQKVINLLSNRNSSTKTTDSKIRFNFKDMPKMGDNDIQGSLMSSTSLGIGITDNIGHVHQMGGVLSKRLQDLVSTVGRMTSLLLTAGLTNQYEDEDVERVIKRSIEFDAMFARNHLYEIQRLLKDTKQLAASKSPRVELETKISAALKSVTQALQVYAKHVNKGARVKYQQVVPIFQSISTIHCLLEQLTGQRLFPFRQELEVSCSYMKQILLEMSVTEKQSISTVNRKPARSKPTVRHKPSTDLSMYSRRRLDWRRKTASLARAKFGSPSSKKHHKKPDCISEKGNVEKNKTDFTENDILQHNCKIPGKSHGPVKEHANNKEVPYRTATRAVPEDNVTTMMEMIPNEPVDDGKLCLDDSTFQALKQLNGTHAPLRQETLDLESQQQDGGSIDSSHLVGKSVRDETRPSSSNHTFPLSLKSDSSETKSPVRSKPGFGNCKPASAGSVGAEPSNVQLVCVNEEETSKFNSSLAHVVDTEIKKDKSTTLTIQEETKAEALEYRQKMIDYQRRNSHYKDGRALDIVDRLANRILKEMVMDFQKEEMNNVIQTLYNLEFQ